MNAACDNDSHNNRSSTFSPSLTGHYHYNLLSATTNNMKVIIASVTFLAVGVSASVVFSLSTELNGQGIRKSWVVDRWICHNLSKDDLDNKASWAFVDAGLANGCELYEDVDCKGRSLYIKKNNSNVLGPGPVNLTDYNFDNVASSFICL
ncbi:hypothetical protein BKA66DRAFT_456682 [Pyrenochaeta sp. MPI-SDFR-AT-0127]|nr:hypothetical protein BKA66DRAFT_456682 [Pyrenochaeta sp. MPI-SDFR-AT-0127]